MYAIYLYRKLYWILASFQKQNVNVNATIADDVVNVEIEAERTFKYRWPLEPHSWISY